MPLSSALFVALLIGLPPAVYGDAIAHGIGRIPGDKPSMSAGAWGILSALPSFGILFVIGYLLSRGELIAKAAAHPVYVPKRRRAVSFCLLFLSSCLGTGLSVLLATA
jgi:hypothetical protein